MDSQQHQSFVLRRSWLHLGVCLLGVLIAVAVLVVMPMPAAIRAALGLLLVATAMVEASTALLRSRDTIRSFSLFRATVDDDAAQRDRVRAPLTILIRRGDDDRTTGSHEHRGVIHAGSVAMPLLVSILYSLESDRWWRRIFPRVIAVWPDSMPPDEFRQLRVLLKWG